MRLSHRQADGSSLRQHLAAAMAAGSPPNELMQVTLPPHGRALWAVFRDVARARPQGMAPGGIPCSELLAWQQLHGVRLTSWEAETITEIDSAYLTVAADLRDKDARK